MLFRIFRPLFPPKKSDSRVKILLEALNVGISKFILVVKIIRSLYFLFARIIFAAVEKWSKLSDYDGHSESYRFALTRGDFDDTYGVCDVLALGVSDADVIDLFMLPLGLPTLLRLSFNTDDSFVL